MLSCTLTNESAADVLQASDVLAVLEFDFPARLDSADPTHVATGLPCLKGPAKREVWRSSSTVSKGRDGGLGWASSADELFAATIVDVPLAGDLEAAAYEGWNRLLDVCMAHRCPHVVRGWNHVPRINHGSGDGEQYKRFCLGRYRAFQGHGLDASRYPAGSAVGHRGDALVIYLLARSQPGRHFENPRQVSAYRYPRRYGPEPPSFARATLVTWPACGGAPRTTKPCSGMVFISGTASIVGHRSANEGNINRQLGVTFQNIGTLLDAIGSADHVTSSLRPDVVRVYVRQVGHLATIRDAVDAEFGADRSIYVHADICRSELDVEIEGVCWVDG